MIYELRVFNTDRRYNDDIRYRQYTSSRTLAKYFEKIPKIRFSDSGHGIVFGIYPKPTGKPRLPCINILDSYVRTELAKIKNRKEAEKKCQ